MAEATGANASAVDDTPAESLGRYVWLMSGPHQLVMAGLALATAGLNLAPIELQRRLVDDAIAAGDFSLLTLLGLAYGGVLLAHQAVKFALGFYQSWVSERTAAYTRRHLYGLAAHDGGDPGGELVSILNSEVDKLGGFVGEGPSKAAVNMATLVAVLTYMAVVEPQIAAVAALLIAPQAILTPLVQRRLNRLIERRLLLLRAFGDTVGQGRDPPETVAAEIVAVLRNRLSYMRVKLAMKAALNLLNGAAPLAILLYGGWLVIQEDTTVGVLLAFVTGFNRMADPIRELIAFYRQCAQASVQHDLIAQWMRKLT
jgi:ABC-type bacteriocin/lantibiotic exporter with double-glycine peptidase domain